LIVVLLFYLFGQKKSLPLCGGRRSIS